MADTTLDDTIQGLCAALDTCPDAEVSDLLAILADALEDAGDGRAAGLRRIAVKRWRPLPQNAVPERWGWKSIKGARIPVIRPHHVRREIWVRLSGHSFGGMLYRWWDTRSAAYLALAAALAEDVP